MPTRSQLTEERLDAVIEILEAEGILQRTEADELERTRELHEANERAKKSREQRGKGPERNGGGG
jgi:hypothetical protein